MNGARGTAEIRPEVEAYVKQHYTSTEDISCSRCGRTQEECTIYFGPTFIGTLQGRRPNYDPMCFEDAVEYEMNQRADTGEWDPDADDDESFAPQLVRRVSDDVPTLQGAWGQVRRPERKGSEMKCIEYRCGHVVKLQSAIDQWITLDLKCPGCTHYWQTR